MDNEKSNKSKMHHRGKFIVIDGGEGAGKTTALKEALKKLGEEKFLMTHEPGGTNLAEKIREISLSPEAGKASAEVMFGLVWAARADHIKKKIKPALEQGLNVVCDRFDSSTYAYQIYAYESPHLETLFWETRKIFIRGAEPDLYVLFDIDPKVGLERVAKRKGEANHFDNRELAYHQRVSRGFSEFFKKVPCQVIDAGKSVDDVSADLVKVISRLLKG